jgi:hypothetical protein
VRWNPLVSVVVRWFCTRRAQVDSTPFVTPFIGHYPFSTPSRRARLTPLLAFKAGPRPGCACLCDAGNTPARAPRQ